MRNILVPTDFSAESNETLRLVLEAFKGTATSVRVLLVNTYTLDLKDGPGDLIKLNDELKAASKKNLEKQKLEELIWVRNPNIKIETSSHMGSLSNVILNLIKKENIDLVVFGKSEKVHDHQIEQVLKSQCPFIYAEEDTELNIMA